MKFKVSIISAIYNTEKYLDEMIESVIRQDIGFKENIQLILVNDGSDDDSLMKCYNYQKRYEENIKVIDIPHRGVSYARNTGLTYATGEYINFLDSDDKLQEGCLSKLYNFLTQNKEYIDLVAMPIIFFDAEKGQHILNNKFIKDDIIHIDTSPQYIQLSASSTLIRKEALQKKKFKENMRYAEDALLITDIIMERGKYGVVSGVNYYYRRRLDNSSAIQQGRYLADWYTSYIKEFSLEIINKYKNNLGKVPLYIQYLVMYDLQWRINTINKTDTLNNNQKLVFYEDLKLILRSINVNTILKQKNINIRNKIKVILLKLSW